MNRDSIVFYKDWWDAIQSLPEEKRLEAITAVMDYAFEGVEPSDTMLRFATAYMRDKIDRDRNKYERAVQQRREAVKKRWEKQKGNSEARSDKESYDRILPNTTESKCTRSNTEEYLHDHEHEHIHDHDHNHGQIFINKNLLTDNNARTPARKGQPVGSFLDDQIAECKNSPIWIEGVRKKFNLGNKKEVDRLLDEFAADMLCQETQVRNPKKLFISWLSEKKRKESGTVKPVSGLGVGEYRNARGERTYNGSTIVPESAPPRPSAGHWWSEPSNAWCNMI